jgi:hypothetical protein
LLEFPAKKLLALFAPPQDPNPHSALGRSQPANQRGERPIRIQSAKVSSSRTNRRKFAVSTGDHDFPFTEKVTYISPGINNFPKA